MATLVTDRFVEDQIRSERARSGGDSHDEVWEGTYMMTPLANLEHQEFVLTLASILREILVEPRLGMAYPGANVSDREKGWEHNYRTPDVVAVLNESKAKNCGTHFCGGPDFLVEIVSTDDRSREKLAFYGKIGVRELLVIDRDPWGLELYSLRDDELHLIGRSNVEQPELLKSDVVPLSFRLIAGDPRPRIEITHREDSRRWLV